MTTPALSVIELLLTARYYTEERDLDPNDLPPRRTVDHGDSGCCQDCNANGADRPVAPAPIHTHPMRGDMD